MGEILTTILITTITTKKMANNQILKDDIAAVIKANGNNEITGEILKDALVAIINQFGSGGLLIDIAQPGTVPISNDVVGFYLANANGVYPNFGGYEIENNDLTIFSNKSGAYVGTPLISMGDYTKEAEFNVLEESFNVLKDRSPNKWFVNVDDFVDELGNSAIQQAINSVPEPFEPVLICGSKIYEKTTFDAANPLTRNNVTIIGAGKPYYQADLTHLILNGTATIIKGSFFVLAHGFKMYDLGFDVGRDVCNAHYAGVAQDAFCIYQSITVAPYGPVWTGFEAKNIMTLCKNASDPAHAFLDENTTGGNVYNITAIYGGHGYVNKSMYGTADRIYSYAHHLEAVIIKSDHYAQCVGLTIDNIVTGSVPPGSTPYENTTNLSGVMLNPATKDVVGVTIGKISVDNCYTGLNIICQPGFRLLKTNIDSFQSLASIQMPDFALQFNEGAIVTDFIINTFRSLDSYNAVISFLPCFMINVRIKYLYAETKDQRGLAVHLFGYSNITIDYFETKGVWVACYCLSQNSRIFVGKEIHSASNFNSGKFYTDAGTNAIAPGLNSPNFANYGEGAPVFEFILENYGVRLIGFVRKTINGDDPIEAIQIVRVPPNFLPPNVGLSFVSPTLPGLKVPAFSGQWIYCRGLNTNDWIDLCTVNWRL